MSEASVLVMRGKKSAGIIENISLLYDVSLEDATNIYYKTEITDLIEDGVSDLHCRSYKYLATLIWEDVHEAQS